MPPLKIMYVYARVYHQERIGHLFSGGRCQRNSLFIGLELSIDRHGHVRQHFSIGEVADILHVNNITVSGS